MFRPAAALALSLACSPASAHPHVFVDVDFELIFENDGRLAAIRTHWLYDAFYSEVVVEDGSRDKDGDGALSPDELKGMQGFDSDWDPGSDGDLHVSQAGRSVSLGPPGDWTAEWTDGRIGSHHTRAFDPPIDMSKGTVSLQPYDVTFYFSYKVAGPVRFTGRSDCRSTLREPDLGVARKATWAALAKLPRDVSPEEAGWPKVGAYYAETILVDCP